MRKLTYGKKYGNNEINVTWSSTGQGQEAVKLIGTFFDDDDIEEETIFIKNNQVFAQNKKSIVFGHGVAHFEKSFNKNDSEFVDFTPSGSKDIETEKKEFAESHLEK